jgi:AcrR family transcriptional regulator
MHTNGMEVKDQREGRDQRVAQGEATRAALLSAARELFGSKGYAATSTEEIVSLAGVTKGALYHHFADKESLFKVVFEQVQRETSDLAVAEFLEPDAWGALVSGCTLWVDAHLDPAVRQIALTDARAVLGWEEARAVETRFSTVALRGALRRAMRAGVLEARPLRPLALMLSGALSEACQYVAESADTSRARQEVSSLIVGLLSGMRARPVEQAETDAAAPATSGDGARQRPDRP